MNAARWKQVNELFHTVLDQPASQRAAYLARAAGGDAELAREVESLLLAHQSSDDFLETPAWGVAPELMFDDEDSLAGKTVGPYRVSEEIGRGGMGVVYAAEDTRLGRDVALKVLPAEFHGDDARRERLRREARAVAALSHPSIATIYALEEYDGVLYMVSELVRGRTLREELADGPLPRERLLPTLLAIADGLAAAHDRGVVHRDLKPENIVRGRDGQVKLLDFGLARMTAGDAAPAITTLTMKGAAIGTPGYMAPEQLSGGTIDTRADTYAFGVLAAELATGKHPFTSGSGVWTMPEIEPLVRRCLNAIPDQRYRSGAEVAAALRAFEQGVVASGGDAAWWWRFHQGAISVVLAAMPATAWALRGYAGIRPYGSWVFFTALALATISVTLRLNLLFIARVQPAMLAHHRKRVFPLVPALDAGLAVLMLAAALRLAGEQDEVAGLVIGLSVVLIASVFLIEPATTKAAGISSD